MRRLDERVVRVTLGVVAVLVLAGCTAILGGEPTILSTTPADGATGVAIDTAITVELDGRIPDGDLSEVVSVLQGSSPIAASYALDGQTLTITPSAPLALGTEYTVSTATGSAGFTTAPLAITASSGEGPLSTAVASLAGAEFAANGSGVVQASGALDEGGTFTVAAPLFVPQTLSIADATLGGGVYSASVELAPYIFVPDFGNNRVVRLPAVDAPASDYVSITTVAHGGGTYNLQGPIYLHTDYNAGLIYVLDSPANPGESGSPGTGPSVLVRLADFPPESGGEDAEIKVLSDVFGAGQDVSGALQLAVLDDGRVVIPSFNNALLAVVPADFSQSATAAALTPSSTLAALGGIAPLGSTEFVFNVPDYNTGAVDLQVLASPSATAFTEFVSGGIGDGSGPAELVAATTLVFDPISDRLYVSDTGVDGQSFTAENGRIGRYNADGTSRANYGTFDADSSGGAGEFRYPLALGVLPDRRLYIMDEGLDRLVSIELSGFTGGDADWQESAADAGFSFEYWFNYS